MHQFQCAMHFMYKLSFVVILRFTNTICTIISKSVWACCDTLPKITDQNVWTTLSHTSWRCKNVYKHKPKPFYYTHLVVLTWLLIVTPKRNQIDFVCHFDAFGIEIFGKFESFWNLRKIVAPNWCVYWRNWICRIWIQNIYHIFFFAQFFCIT